MEYMSERITNISEMEELISEEGYLIQSIKKELEQTTPSIDFLRRAVCATESVNKKMKDFEFRIEIRKVHCNP